MATGKYRAALLAGAAFALALATIAVYQSRGYASDLASYVLFRGRIVLSSGDLVFAPDDPEENGAASHVLDGDVNSPAILAFPAQHPHGTFLLIDTALSHWPGEPPQARRPLQLEIYNGACGPDCDPRRFHRYGRMRNVTLQLLARRANNPDEEFVIPQAHPIWERSLELPDRPGPIVVPLSDAPAAPPATAWPENMSYWIVRGQVHTIYPGQVFADRFALAEVRYSDAAQNQ